MDTISRVIVGTWVAGAAGQAIAAGALLRSGMIRRYPVITGTLAMAALVHGYLLSTLAGGGWPAYARAWHLVQPLEVAMTSAMVMEAVYATSCHFPRSRALAGVLLCILGVLSMLAVAPMANSFAPPHLSGLLGQAAGLLLRRRNWTLCLFLVLLGCRLVMQGLEPRPRPNVARYARAGLIALGASAAGDWMIRAGLGYWGNAAGQLMLAVPPLGSVWLWGSMSRAGEWYEPTWDAGAAAREADASVREFQKKARRAAAGRD